MFNSKEMHNYCWVQLAACARDGKMIRNGYVRLDDIDAINRWRREYNNTGVLRSICVYAKPNHRARYVAPMFFCVRPQGDFAEARNTTIELEELLLSNMNAPDRSVEIYLTGDGTFELVMSHEVFQPLYSPHIFTLNREFAELMKPGGLKLIDTSVYTETHLWQFPNSRISGTSPYKIPIAHEELYDAEKDQLIEMARYPRSVDNYAQIQSDEFVDWHYREWIQELEDKSVMCSICDGIGGAIPASQRPAPCIKAVEASELSDGTRHRMYLLLARYFAYLNMHYDQIVQRLMIIDASHPIRDPADIKKAAALGCRHPSLLACDDPMVMRYCQKDRCSLGKSAPNCRKDQKSIAEG